MSRELLLEARHYSADIVKEFDSLDELRQFDDRYLVNADSAIIDNICKTLSVWLQILSISNH